MEWVIIAERMPAEGQPVWLWGDGRHMQMGVYSPGSGSSYLTAAKWIHFNAEISRVEHGGYTHWQAITKPEPPE